MPTRNTKSKPPHPNDRQPAGAPRVTASVSAEMAQIRVIAAACLNEARAQGKDITPEHALTYACAIWTARQVEQLLWQHGIPKSLEQQ